MTSSPSSIATFRRSSRALGTLIALAGLALAALTALAVTDLAHGNVAAGVAWLALVVAVRWALALAHD